MQNKLISYLCLLLVSIVFACERDEENVSSSSMEQTHVVTTPTKLASLNLSKNHEIQFWQFPNNELGINRVYPMDDNSSLTAMMMEPISATSYVEVYKKFAGRNIDLTILKNLEDAYTHHKQYERVRIQEAKKLPMGEQAQKNTSNARESSCSRDVYKDNYGENWFLRKHCPIYKNSFSSGYCVTGLSQVYDRFTPESMFTATVMAADFRESISFYIERWYCVPTPVASGLCYFLPVVMQTIKPRTVSSWTISGNADTKVGTGNVTSTCQLVHFGLGIDPI